MEPVGTPALEDAEDDDLRQTEDDDLRQTEDIQAREVTTHIGMPKPQQGVYRGGVLEDSGLRPDQDAQPVQTDLRPRVDSVGGLAVQIGTPTPQRGGGVFDLPKTMQRFDPQYVKDADAWLRYFERLCSAARILEDRMPDTFIACTTFEVAANVDGMLEEGANWAQVRRHVQALYGNKMSKLAAHRELATRRQQKREDVVAFAAAFKTLARLAEMAEDVYTQLFVAALLPQIQASVQLMLGPASKFVEAVEHARAVEDRLKLTGGWLAMEPEVVAVASAPGPRNAEIRRCFICNKSGHVQAECWSKPGRRRGRGQKAGLSQNAGWGQGADHGGRQGAGVGQGADHGGRQDAGVGQGADRLNRHKSIAAATLGELWLVPGNVNGTRVPMAIDTGASQSMMALSHYDEQRDGPLQPSRVQFQTADKKPLEGIEGVFRGRVEVAGATCVIDVTVCRHLCADFLLGKDALGLLRATVSADSKSFVTPHGEVPIPMPTIAGEKQTIMMISTVDTQDRDQDLREDAIEPPRVLGDTCINDEQRSRLQLILTKADEVFASSKSRLGRAQVQPMQIAIKTGAVPVAQARRRISQIDRNWLRQEVEELLATQVVSKSSSAWAANPVFVYRPGKDKPRIAIDYRPLNEATEGSQFPMPVLHDVLDRMAGAMVFSTLDLKAAYHQCPLTPKDRALTAFYGHDGLYEFNVVPFGLKGAPAYFQSTINNVLSGIDGVYAYLDDILVFSDSIEKHFSILQELFERLQSVGMLLSKDKCHFFASSVAYLGVILDANGRRPNDEKIAAIRDMPPPTDVPGVRRTLGCFGFYREFIPGFAAMAEPLSSLLKKGVKFAWGERQQEAFGNLKSALTSSTSLVYPDWTAPMELVTDASGVALGAVLHQLDEDGRPAPLAFISRALTSAERNYPTTQQECLAVVWAIHKFRIYLHHRRFTVVTDHSALKWLQTKPELTGRLARWSLELQEFDFKITHRPGKTNVVADALSRHIVAAAPMTSLTRETIVSAQAEDDFCSTVRQALAGGKEGGLDQELFFIDGNALMRLGKSHQPARLVVPEAIKDKVLQQLHDDPSGGHQGMTRTYQSAMLRYFWPKMASDVQDYVKNCGLCAERKAPRPGPQVLGHIAADAPFDIVAMDITGPLVTTTSGNKYILVIADVFSKFVVTVPMMDQTASSVIDAFLNHWVAIFGAPRKLLTDNGTHFTSAQLSELVATLHSKKIWTTAYHPQTDGQVERFNRLLADALSINSRRLIDWDQSLAFVSHAYNSTTHATTGVSPFRILFGFEAWRPTDAPPEEADTDSWQARMRGAREDVNEVVSSHYARLRQGRDLGSTAPIRPAFQPGDRVLVKDPSSQPDDGGKLKRRWTQAAEVLTAVSNKAYRVKMLRTNREVTVNVARLKLAPSRPVSVPSSDEESEENDEAAPTTMGARQRRPNPRYMDMSDN
jgi:hypothetical protein